MAYSVDQFNVIHKIVTNSLMQNQTKLNFGNKLFRYTYLAQKGHAKNH